MTTSLDDAAKLLELAKSAHDKRQDDQATFCLQLSIASSLLAIAGELVVIRQNVSLDPDPETRGIYR